jgi:hypothetical protein
MGGPTATGWDLAARLPGRLLLGFTIAGGQRAGDSSAGLMGAPVQRRMRDRQDPTERDGSD